ncbi:MAG: YceI family protein [Bdellovibrionota bacterium]
MKTLLVALALVSLPAFAAKKPETFKVDTKTSTVGWEGRKLGGVHHGELKLKDGALKVENGALVSGDVTIDMTSLKDEDLTDSEMNAKLVNHLKSDDFFSIEKNPTSHLKITKVEQKDGKTLISGDLTIKGITKPITFPATVTVEKNKLSAKGDMEVDRTMYDIKFRSLKFFANIGDKVIKDQFGVTVDIKASK